MTKIELPIKYYLEHFRELTAILETVYHPFFEEAHHKFFSTFYSLSEDAQCLFLRMMNRKGDIFFRKTLRYGEITDFDKAVNELLETGFARDFSLNELEKAASVLTKSQFTTIFREHNLEYKKSWSREECREKFLEARPYPFTFSSEFILQGKTEELRYLLFLFFGRIQENLSLYTLRDLGIRRSSKKDIQKARFESLDEARSHYFYADPPVSELITDRIPYWPRATSVQTMSVREELLVKISEELKKQGSLEEALKVTSFCEQHPGREKKIRLLYELGKIEETKAALLSVMEAPFCDEELLFADDFYARKFEGKRIGLLTETLRSAKKVMIDESYFRQPEAGVVEFLRMRGGEAFHLENYLWVSLFGLFFWEELFESDSSSLFNEFERFPRELSDRSFLRIHAQTIHEKLTHLEDPASMLRELQNKVLEKNKIPNGIFSWHESIPHQLELLFRHAPPTAIRRILTHMAEDFVNRSTGFPDLLAIDNGQLRFYEIKAEGDSLKRQQLLQIKALQKAGFHVEVLQVSYTYNPDLTYVVVDLETTGRLSPYHRITEIGAVKVRSGKIIDRYQTLINPERTISREIQELTGITNEMVKNAPVFSEVADTFSEFCKDAVFVAHNVGFDYGFLQAEFERLEKKFVRPYICTKVSMRKYFPGLASYSLKNLTSHFEIPLLTHHRAMCDAEAAARLLQLINQKRAEAVKNLDTLEPELTNTFSN